MITQIILSEMSWVKENIKSSKELLMNKAADF